MSQEQRTVDVVVDYTSMTLDDLAARANSEHALASEHANSAVRYAIMAGETLIAARSRLADGVGWRQWLEDSTTLYFTTAAKYMRFARHRRDIEEWLDDGGERTVTAVRVFLEKFPSSPHQGNPAKVRQREEALALRKEGMTVKEVAATVGVAVPTAVAWLNPGYAEKRRQSENRRRARRQAAARALAEKERREERDALAKSAGGATSEAYAQVRRSAAALDKALAACNLGQREPLRKALALVHQAEDQIVQALRAERTLDGEA